MRIIVRGWGRNAGEKQIMDAPLADAINEDEIKSYSMGETYLHVKSDGYRPGVHVSAGTQLNLGGRYLVRVELTREEIRQLFLQTHGGDIVRMFASFIEDEERAKRVQRWGAHKARLAAIEAETAEPPSVDNK
jgi:hypothetical protein